MQFKIAELSDIDATLKLHAQYQIDGIKEEDKADGFVTTAFTKEELTQLITQEQGLFIAKNEELVLGYIMAASWDFWSKYKGQTLKIYLTLSNQMISKLTRTISPIKIFHLQLFTSLQISNTCKINLSEI